MASTYPTTLDTVATNKTDDTVAASDHPAHHNLIADAVNKIEAELGTDPSGASTDVKTRLDAVDTALAAKATAAALASHEADTTAIHGIADTAALVLTNDSRLSDARAPSGAAGGVLSGTYPNPGFAADMATQTELDAEAAARASADALLAPLASPTLTGTPAAPTAAQGTNTTQLATTAYVQTETGLLIPSSLVDAKGDLLVGSADNTVIRKAVGTDGQVLTADSTQSGGIKWADAAAGGIPKAVRVYSSTDAASFLTTSTGGAGVPVPFDSELTDNDTTHFTSAAALTGTVAKAASSTAVVGTGTSFTTELSVGQVISVPGTAAEKKVVTAIADNTHLTVASAFANTASGQTATRVNSALVARTASTYLCFGQVTFSSNATGTREAWLRRNAATVDPNANIWDVLVNATTGAGNWTNCPFNFPVDLAQWDFLELYAWQDSGGNLTLRGGSLSKTSLGLLQVGAAGTGL